MNWSLLTQTSPVAWLMLSAVFFGAGEYLSKKFALVPCWQYAALISLFYCLGGLAWLPAIARTNQLAVTGMIWYAICMVVTVGIGLIAFGEHVTLTKAIGLACAFLSVLLLSI